MARVPEFSVGATLGRAVDMFLRNLLPLGGCIALVTIIAAVLQFVAALGFNNGSFDGGSFTAEGENPIGSIATLVIALASAAFASAVNGHAAELEINGQKPTFSGAWNAGWRNLLPQAGLLILLWIMLIVGWSFLLVPGAILGVLFGAAPAAQVAERCGVFAAFGHSFKAGQGNGWALFGYYVAAFVLSLVVVVVIYLLVMALVLALIGGASLAEGASPSPSPIMAVVTAVIAVPIYVFLAGAVPLMFGSIPAAAYASLRQARGEQAVSSVFD